VDPLKRLTVLLLVAAVGVSFLFRQPLGGLAIAAVLIINTVISFVTEVRTLRSMEALQDLGEVTARMVRVDQSPQ